MGSYTTREQYRARSRISRYVRKKGAAIVTGGGDSPSPHRLLGQATENSTQIFHVSISKLLRVSVVYLQRNTELYIFAEVMAA